MHLHKQISPLFLLKTFTCLLFLGRAWQFLRWDAPFRALLWDQNWMEGIVGFLLGMNWESYVSDPKVDVGIQAIIQGFGIFFLIGAVGTLFVGKKNARKATFIVLSLGTLGLMFLAFLYTKERFFQAGQFIEYTIQWSLPMFTWFFAYGNENKDRFVFWGKIAILATFLGHGLYAMGFYPVPAIFMEMTLNMLGISENGAIRFLWIMGALDIIVIIGIFIPQYARYFLLYASAWGIATAFARVLGYGYWQMPLESLDASLFEMLVRLGHGGLPWVILSILNRNHK